MPLSLAFTSTSCQARRVSSASQAMRDGSGWISLRFKVDRLQMLQRQLSGVQWLDVLLPRA